MRFRPVPPPRAHHRRIASALVLGHVVVPALPGGTRAEWQVPLS